MGWKEELAAARKAEAAPVRGRGWQSELQAAQTPRQRARAAVERSFGGERNGAGLSFMDGATLGTVDELAGAADYLGTAFSNMIGRGGGYSARDAYEARTAAVRERQDEFARDHPKVDMALKGAGGLATTVVPVGGAALGGARVAGGGVRGALAAGRAAVRPGATVAGAYGFNSGRDAESRIGGAITGGAAGAVIGPLAAAGGTLAAPMVGRALAPIVRGGENAFSRAENFIANARGQYGPPKPLPNANGPSTLAARRSARVVDPDAARAEATRYLDAGVQPTFADAAGPRFRREMKVMGLRSGDAPQDAATRIGAYVGETEQGAKGAAIARLRQASPSEYTHKQLGENVEAFRQQVGRADYGAAGPNAVPVSPEVASALGDEPAQAAINEALKGARIYQDEPLIAELESLRRIGTDDAPSGVSANALDKVRQAMRDLRDAAGAGDNPNRFAASGYGDRMRRIDSELDKAPGLTEARARQRNLFGVIEQAEGDYVSPLNTDPRDYADFVAGLTPEQRLAAQVRATNETARSLGGGRERAVMGVEGLTSPFARENIPALLGDEGSALLANNDVRIEQLRNARSMLSRSDTAQNQQGLIDSEALGNVVRGGVEGVRAAHGDPLAAVSLMDRLVRSRGAGQAERNEFAEIGLTRIGSMEELQKMLTLADRSADIGRQAPKRVRDYVRRATGLLGPQNPLTEALGQRLLSPRAVLADEDTGAPQ